MISQMKSTALVSLFCIHKGSYMSVHVLLNLLNEEKR